jgi:phage baseplate assembly protein W
MKDQRDRFIGLSQPLTNSKNGYFNPSITSDERIKSNLKHLLLTNRGERIGHPDFGCDIYKILFENIDNINLPLDSLRDRIKEQVRF